MTQQRDMPDEIFAYGSENDDPVWDADPYEGFTHYYRADVYHADRARLLDLIDKAAIILAKYSGIRVDEWFETCGPYIHAAREARAARKDAPSVNLPKSEAWRDM